MVAGKRQAIDSVLIKANASMDSLIKREILDDGDTYCREIKEDEGESHLPKKNTDTIDKPDKTHTIGSFYGQKHLNNHTHYSPTDPDAKISYKPGKPRRLNYLGQVSVDTHRHIITHIQGNLADKKDSQCLPEVLEQTKENLSSEGIAIREVICDGNYSSAESLKKLEKMDISGFIPNFGKYKHSREGFTYHTEEDYYTCIQGKKLPFKKIVRTSRGSFFREYRSSNSDCKHCTLRERCIGKSTQKQIRDSVDKPYFDMMHQKMKTPYARYLKKIRQSTVEPVIGTLIEYGGLKKIRTKGIERANKCMLLAAVAYNLKKWLRYTQRKVKTSVIALNGDLTELLNLVSHYFSMRNCVISETLPLQRKLIIRKI